MARRPGAAGEAHKKLEARWDELLEACKGKLRELTALDDPNLIAEKKAELSKGYGVAVRGRPAARAPQRPGVVGGRGAARRGAAIARARRVERWRRQRGPGGRRDARRRPRHLLLAAVDAHFGSTLRLCVVVWWTHVPAVKALFPRSIPPSLPVLAQACLWCLGVRMWRVNLP